MVVPRGRGCNARRLQAVLYASALGIFVFVLWTALDQVLWDFTTPSSTRTTDRSSAFEKMKLDLAYRALLLNDWAKPWRPIFRATKLVLLGWCAIAWTCILVLSVTFSLQPPRYRARMSRRLTC
eukprot:gnl/TRDRNA2_/TRDRNA2_82674_c1_seq3.p1 gnl/TRDRNA2_/TRDRNA2_82674_c1~~gnl/TRDRNA2_/TRDRNA2_82674_c1_seq3.p1  ORF type:complete len:124 (+),score=2.12 gnl/TRDRNA2_/TRDRNA2_82674_c1_seq3:137-508(+)